jgi:transposase
VPDEPGLPSAEELAVLPHGVLAERLAEAYRVIAQLTAQVREMAARVEEAVAENGRLAARVGALERRAGKDSSTSSKPPSSDSPYKKKPRDRSLREKGERAPGKQPGEPGTTMRLVDGPAHRFWYPPAECRGCGADLSGQEIFA